MARRAVDSSVEVSEDDGREIWEAARVAHEKGRSIFTCAVTVGESTGSGLGLGRKSAAVKYWSPGYLIESIEAMGWRLDHLDHVWVQTEHNQALGGAAVVRGLTKARLLFRRTTG